MMRYIRVCRALDDGEILAVIEQGVPFETGGHIEFDGRESEMIDLGACEDFACAESRGRFIFSRLETHPLADTHEDAPKVRFKPDATDAPEVMFCPARVSDIVAHIMARPQNALPAEVCADLKHRFAERQDVPMIALRAVGFSMDEIKNHPRATTRARAAQTATQQQSKNAARAARIARRLAKSKPSKTEP